MKQCTAILGLLLLVSCARKFGISDAFRKGIPADMQQWVLDSTYHLYIREVFMEAKGEGNNQVKANNNNFTGTDKLIEVEYLLFSPAQQKMVYMATIPDKYQTYYAQKGRFLKRWEMNAYDFSTFRFGKKQPATNAIVFDGREAGDSDTWLYSITQDSILRVQQVEKRQGGDVNSIFLVDEAVNPGATFVRVDNFEIAFRDMGKEKRKEKRLGRPPLLRYCKDKTIYYRQHNNKYTIYFRFDRNLVGRSDSAISFGNSRLINLPF